MNLLFYLKEDQNLDELKSGSKAQLHIFYQSRGVLQFAPTWVKNMSMHYTNIFSIIWFNTLSLSLYSFSLYTNSASFTKR